jgi:hypothetical protein
MAKKKASTRKYYVYVIRLSRKVWNNRRFREENEHYAPDGGKPCVYVGHSVRTPEERFAQHQRGYKPGRYVRKYGKRLMPKLYEKYNPLPTRDDAEEREEKLAKRLRKRGYAVRQH